MDNKVYNAMWYVRSLYEDGYGKGSQHHYILPKDVPVTDMSVPLLVDSQDKGLLDHIVALHNTELLQRIPDWKESKS